LFGHQYLLSSHQADKRQFRYGDQRPFTARDAGINQDQFLEPAQAENSELPSGKVGKVAVMASSITAILLKGYADWTDGRTLRKQPEREGRDRNEISNFI
jgi:hypothetical protein